jgi:ketosteroid isomerase-like protein
MLASDVTALNELLAENLVFTNHLGQRLGKADDISAHASGALTILKLETSEQHITFVNGGDVAIVSVRAQIVGRYAGQPAGGDFRFTRVWARTAGKKWQVVAAHAGMVA